MEDSRKRWLRRALVGAGVVALIGVSRALPILRWLEAFRDWLAGAGAIGWATFVAAYIAASLLLVPAVVLGIAAGLIFGFMRGIALVTIAILASAVTGFLLSRYAARRRVEEYATRHPKFAAVDRAIAAGDWKIVILMRLSTLFPFGLTNYLLGLTAIPFGRYLVATWIGTIPETLLYVSLGALGDGRPTGGPRERTIAEYVYLAIGLAATVAVTVYVGRMAKQRLRRLDESGWHEPTARPGRAQA